ncbi:MAG: solute carrier family 26 protein [Ilumatobacteraceae bacterium]|nr:solute carrier family 26 protein [Ilumatobacteraceae bacterium]
MTTLLHRIAPITAWAPGYDRRNLRSDVIAGFTVSALLVPQGLAYALLAGLPPQVGLYASIVPVIVYAIFGTSRQLAVGPVAIVSLMTATALGGLYEQDSESYLAGAAVLALLVGAVHLVLRFGRLGFVTNFLSHSVLVGFTAASAVIIVASQIKHVLGISIPRTDSVLETAVEVVKGADATHAATLALGSSCIVAFLVLKRFARKVPAALVVLVASIAASQLLDLESRGVSTVGEIPNDLPGFSIPTFDGSALGTLVTAAIAITLVGFMESIAVAKVYARRHRYDIEPNQELFGLGMANVASGLIGGFPVTGGFSRTAVSDAAGTKTPLASIIAALLIIPTVLLLTPIFAALPNAALGATIIVAVINLVDVAEMRHIARVKRSDLIGLWIAFTATLVFGIELGMFIAIVASMLVVFARMSRPHSATLGRIPDTTNYRNVDRFPAAGVESGIRVIRIDAALSFVNAQHVKDLCLGEARRIDDPPRVLIVDCSGINDIDATGVEALSEILNELDPTSVSLHLCDVKGPVRDVLHRAGLWGRLDGRVHATAHQAVEAVQGRCDATTSLRAAGVDERPTVTSDAITTPTDTTPTDTTPTDTTPTDTTAIERIS